MTVDLQPIPAIHPGVAWRELIQSAGCTQASVAAAIGVSPRHLNQILQQRALPTAPVTVAFAEHMGVSPRLLWQFRCNYELGVALGWPQAS